MISIPSHGGYDRLRYEKLPSSGYTQGANIKIDGIDASNCVIVETHACGINYSDVFVRSGLHPFAKEAVGWPITPGFEFSGTIKKVGENVENFTVGDKVAGCTLFGAYSSLILVPQEQVRIIPDCLSMSAAASFVCTGLTAWYALFELCKLRKGDSVLIHSAAGGVGSMLVQMAKKLIGCHVVGVVGKSHKTNYAKELGCDSVIDKSSQDLWSSAEDLTVKGYKAIFDANGVETLQESYKHVIPGGRLVSYGRVVSMPKSSENSSGHLRFIDWMKIKGKHAPNFNPFATKKSIMVLNFNQLFTEREVLKEGLNQLFQWVGDEKIQVSKVTEYTLREVSSAHKYLESGNTIGKLVLLTQEPKKEGEASNITDQDSVVLNNGKFESIELLARE